jgi:MFS family permease
VLDRPALRAQMVLVLVVSLLGQNFRVVLPLLTTGTFHAGPRAYGYLTAMLGLGAVIGALVTASRAHATSWSVALSCIAFGVVNLLTAAAPSLVVAYAVMVVMGVANITFNTYARTVLQVNTERRMHGRVLALHNLVFQGTTPLGGPLMGWICQAAGARLSFVIAGAAPLVAVALLLPQLRHTSSGTPDPPAPNPSVPTPPAPNPSAPVRPSRPRAQQPVEPVPPPGPDL